MEINISKILAVFLIFFGERIAIYAEMIGARSHSFESQGFFIIFLNMFAVMMLAGGFLIAGYMLGFNAFKNIWIVSVVSITSILIVEPILAWTIFEQVPTWGAAVGFAMGVFGLLISLYPAL